MKTLKTRSEVEAVVTANGCVLLGNNKSGTQFYIGFAPAFGKLPEKQRKAFGALLKSQCTTQADWDYCKSVIPACIAGDAGKFFKSHDSHCEHVGTLNKAGNRAKPPAGEPEYAGRYTAPYAVTWAGIRNTKRVKPMLIPTVAGCQPRSKTGSVPVGDATADDLAMFS